MGYLLDFLWNNPFNLFKGDTAVYSGTQTPETNPLASVSGNIASTAKSGLGIVAIVGAIYVFSKLK